MMKYMDKTLSKQEAELLNAHAAVCGSCKEELSAYDEVLDVFDAAELIEAPDNFTFEVMEKVNLCEHSFKRVQNGIDNTLALLLGTLSMIAALAFLFINNREQVLSYMDSVPALAGAASFIRPLANLLQTFYTNLIVSATGFIASSSEFLFSYRFLFLGIAVALSLLFVFIKRRKPDGIEAE